MQPGYQMIKIWLHDFGGNQLLEIQVVSGPGVVCHIFKQSEVADRKSRTNYNTDQNLTPEINKTNH